MNHIEDGQAGNITLTTSGPLLREPEAAALLGISPETLRRWREEHRAPPYIRLGGKGSIRYPADHLNRWIAEHGVIEPQLPPTRPGGAR